MRLLASETQSLRSVWQSIDSADEVAQYYSATAKRNFREIPEPRQADAKATNTSGSVKNRRFLNEGEAEGRSSPSSATTSDGKRDPGSGRVAWRPKSGKGDNVNDGDTDTDTDSDSALKEQGSKRSRRHAQRPTVFIRGPET